MRQVVGSIPKRGNYLYYHFLDLVSRQSTSLSFAIQHLRPPEFGDKWGTECLNNRFPLPTCYDVRITSTVAFAILLVKEVISRMNAAGQ